MVLPPALPPPGLQSFPHNSTVNNVSYATQAGNAAAASPRQNQNVSTAPHGKGLAAQAPAPGVTDALAGSFAFGVQPATPQSCSVPFCDNVLFQEVSRLERSLGATQAYMPHTQASPTVAGA